MRLYPPFLVRRILDFLDGIRYAEPWYAVRQQKCKWYAYAEFCVCASKKTLKSLVKCYKMDRIHLIISFCFFLAHFVRSNFGAYMSIQGNLPTVFTYTYMYTCLYILLGERFEPVYFDFHVQRQVDLLALEMSTCTNHCFESDQNVTKP